MLKEQILKALNEQLKHEENNSRIYLQMAAWCDAGEYRGCAKWFYHSSEDETKHKMMIANYIADRNEKFIVSEQKAPECEFLDVLDLFTRTMTVEVGTTKALNELYRTAMSDGDFVTSAFLLPMLTEQIEEEDKVQTILDFIKIAGTTAPGLALIDEKVGSLA